MNDLCRVARVCGLSFLVGFCGLAFGLSGLAWAQGQVGLGYAPDGPNFPTITLNEDQSGAADQPALKEPPPNGFNQQSIWNMRVVGFADDLGCSQSDQIWIEDQHGRIAPAHHVHSLGNRQGSREIASFLEVILDRRRHCLLVIDDQYGAGVDRRLRSQRRAPFPRH